MTEPTRKPAASNPPDQAQPGKPADRKPADKATGKPGPAEFGGPAGPEPTRYGDWERNGRVSDF